MQSFKQRDSFYDALNQNKQNVEVLCNVFSTWNGRKLFNLELMESSRASNGDKNHRGLIFIFLLICSSKLSPQPWMQFFFCSFGNHKARTSFSEPSVYSLLTSQGFSSGDGGTNPNCRDATGCKHNYPREQLARNQMSSQRPRRK